MKLPGTYAAYALIMGLFGQSIGGIHFGFLLANLGALTLLYFIARRLTGSWGAVVGLRHLCVVVAESRRSGTGGARHASGDAGRAGRFLLLLRAREKGSGAGLFWSGFCFGLAFLCKQPGAVFRHVWLLPGVARRHADAACGLGTVAAQRRLVLGGNGPAVRLTV